jgi:hypothetical protein
VSFWPALTLQHTFTHLDVVPVARRLAFICRDQCAELNQTDQRDFLGCGTSIESLPMSALGQKRTLRRIKPMSALLPKADIEGYSPNVRFVPIGDVVIPSRGEYSATMRRRRHTNNWREAACVDRPERLDWFREQRDPRTLRSAAPLRLPMHLSRSVRPTIVCSQ